MKTFLKTLATAVVAFSFIATGLAGDKTEDCVHMKDGKMMMMKDGKEISMAKNMTMKDGTLVRKDGSIVKEGKKMQLSDGDMMTMDGTIKKGAMKQKGSEKKS